jgi:hypothetical protein
MTDQDKLIESLKQLLEVNGYRKGTKAARTCEYSFLQGAAAANPELMQKCPAILLCLFAGRSVIE